MHSPVRCPHSIAAVSHSTEPWLLICFLETLAVLLGHFNGLPADLGTYLVSFEPFIGATGIGVNRWPSRPLPESSLRVICILEMLAIFSPADLWQGSRELGLEGRKRQSVDWAGPMQSERLHVLPGSIALMSSKAVVRPLGMVLIHQSVSCHLQPRRDLWDLFAWDQNMQNFEVSCVVVCRAFEHLK